MGEKNRPNTYSTKVEVKKMLKGGKNMLKLTVLEKKNDEFLVNFELDGENLGEKIVDKLEMMATIETKKEAKIEMYFEENVELRKITVEKYDEEYDIELNKWIYCENDVRYKVEHLKTYKKRKNAVEYANKMAKIYECYVEEL